MSSLRRLRAGAFRIEEASTLEEVLAPGGEARLLPLDSLFRAYPALTVDEEQNRRVRCGNTIRMETTDGSYRLYDAAGEFLALAEAKDGIVTTIKNFFEVS